MTERQKEMDLAWETHREMIVRATEDYDKAMDAHNRAIDETWKAYKEAMQAAWEVYRTAVIKERRND